MNQNETVNILEENDIHNLFKIWERNQNQNQNDPELIVRRLAEVFEIETSKYMLKDPDPFDERHPSPTSDLGKNLKFLFKKENFMNR
jgi:DDB1- and CUL4-associated factor 1